MAIIEQPPRTLALPPAGGRRARASRSASSAVPVATTGWKSWVVHRRPQEDRHHVRRHRHGLLRRRRRRGAADPRSSWPGPTARSCRPTPTTRCSRCTAPRWSSSSSCRWRRPSPTTWCRCRSAPATSPSPASTPSASGRFLVRRHLPATSAWFLGGARRRRLVHVRARTPARAVLAQPRHRLLGPRPADHRHRLADRRRST